MPVNKQFRTMVCGACGKPICKGETFFYEEKGDVPNSGGKEIYHWIACSKKCNTG